MTAHGQPVFPTFKVPLEMVKPSVTVNEIVLGVMITGKIFLTGYDKQIALLLSLFLVRTLVWYILHYYYYLFLFKYQPSHAVLLCV